MRFLAVFLVSVLASASAFAAETASDAPAAAPEQAKPVAAELTQKDKAQVKRIETYLGGIKSIAARFSQVSPDGGVSNGKFYLQRPGKLRMEYEPPVPVLVIASAGNMVYFDKELDQVTHIPLSDTLVGFLARDRIRFDETVVITNFESGSQSLRISVVQTEHPTDGMMTLEFSDKPLTLHNIIMRDSAGESTVVSLAQARFDEKLDSALFVFSDPRPTGSKAIKK